MISEFIMAGITPHTLKHIKGDFGMAENWKTDPGKVLGIMTEAANIWRLVETLENRNCNLNVTAREIASSKRLKPEPSEKVDGK